MLRKIVHADQHETYLAVAIAICNEDYMQFAKTLKSLIRNIYFVLQRYEEVNAKNIVIFLIQDGMEKLTPEFIKHANGRIMDRRLYD